MQAFFLICHFFSEMIRSWRAFTYSGVKEPLTEPYQIGISGSGWYSLYLGVALAHSAQVEHGARDALLLPVFPPLFVGLSAFRFSLYLGVAQAHSAAG